MNFNSYFTIKHTSNLRILLLTLFFIVPLGTIYGQNQLITIAGKNITLLKAFDAIESQTQLSITYSRTKIDVNRTLSVDFKKQKLSIVLDKLLAGTGFTYKIEKGYIVLVPVPVKQEQTEATSKKIQGVIVDTNGDPVIGASIQEKGVAGKGTVSDLDGKFNLSVASNAVLLISYIGFQSLEVKVGNRTSLSLVLKEDHQLLDEVVVIGYGTMEKRAVTSSITSISSKDLVTGLGGSTIATALKGKISGMNVSETSSPNASASFQLRGVASINASSSPLIVIDGIPGGDLRSISQEDIQSIDVLKDASAGAIYGTRAAGGVILVTTKKAKEGPITLSYTGELSTEQVSRRPQVLDRDAFVRFGVGTDLGASTDWYGELLNEGALSQRHVVTLSGGGHTARIYATIMAQDQKGIAIGDNRKDYSGRINANFNLLNDLLEIGLHTEYREAHRDQRSSSSCFDMALKMNPTEHVYDSTSETGYNVLVGGSEYYNPLAEVMLKQTDNVDKWLKADATVKLNLPAGFSAQATLGWEDRQYQQTHYVSALHRTSFDLSGYSSTNGMHLQPSLKPNGDPYTDKLGRPFAKFNNKDLRKKLYLYKGNGKYEGMFLYGKLQRTSRSGTEVKCTGLYEYPGEVLEFVDQVAQFKKVKDGEYSSVNELPSNISTGEENSGIRLCKLPVPDNIDKTIAFNPDYPVIRFAEIYYMLAECKYRSGYKKEAANLFNEVRKRNFENKADPDPVTETNIDKYRILDEWMVEFLGEQRRRTDLRRWGLYTTGSWWDHKPTNDDHYELFPIPEKSISVSNVLKQNPGYGGGNEMTKEEAGIYSVKQID